MELSISLRVLSATLLLVGLAPTVYGAEPNADSNRNPLHLSQHAFDFGSVPAGSSVVKKIVRVTNMDRMPVPLRPSINGNSFFTVATGLSGLCGTVLASGATCDIAVQFSPSSARENMPLGILHMGETLAVDLQNLVILGGKSKAVPAGEVMPTINPLVAKYAWTLPYKGKWSVNFGLTTNYGKATGVQQVTTAGTATSLFVAGMLPNTTYHMQATMTLPNGAVTRDQDHTFTTGDLPPGIPARFPVTLGIVGTPQPGVELLNPVFGGSPSTALATDLEGNVIWTYPFFDPVYGTFLYPPKLIPNGNLLFLLQPFSFPLGLSGSNILREVNLAGETVRELAMSDLNIALAKAGFSVQLANFSHDFELLPNGHLLVITNTAKSFTDLIGYPGVTKVVGDVIVDLDQNWNPVWVWNEFDHLDVNRHPWPAMFPDWTHTNSIAYSKDDGAFILSIRHQDWVIKVDYRDGQGTGAILWKLGKEGDFTLTNGADPIDWFYAQHHATFVTEKTAGTYSITLLDNGDDRVFPPGTQCGGQGAPACLYTTIQQLRLDEAAKTATLEFDQLLPPSLYSNFGGSVGVLPNSDIEYFLSGAAGGSQVFEVTPGADPQTVWQMSTPGTYGYRATRLPSLYPGVQW